MARKKSSMRDKMRSKLKERTQESHKNRDSGGSLKNYFDSDKMEGLSTWWAGKGDHLIDIIPYFAGGRDPRNKKGEPAYVLDIEVHRYVGAMEEMVVCPEQYGEPCPICEEARRLNREKADWKTEIKPLKPSRRVVYNVIVRDGGDQEKKGVQILEIAHWFMEKHLAKIAKDPRGDGFTVFSDPDEGKSISFERTGVGADNTGYDGHRFADRLEPISDGELEQAVCLDDLILLLDYDTIHETFFGKASEAKEEEEKEEDDHGQESSEDHEDEGYEDTPDTEKEEEEKEEEPPKRGSRNRTRRSSKTPKCPQGGVIGEDIDEYDECDDCDLYDKCNDIADTL